jgi:tetratricopeptide (TPR) repeat protein
VNDLLIGLVGALMATNQPVAVSNLVHQTTGMSISMTNTNDPVEVALKKLSDEEDKAGTDVRKMVADNEALGTNGVSQQEMFERIHERFDLVCHGYEGALKTNTNNVRIRLAYANFLEDIRDEDGEQDQLEKALTVCTNDPSIYNNLANIYGHHGPVKTAFEYYAKAIELNPNEPVYYENFATTVYLFRPDAKEYYGINEDQVFAKSFQLYSNAMRLDPDNFDLALDVARGYYGIRPMRTEPALKAFTNALNIAHNEQDRENVYVNFARVEMLAGRFDEARAQLDTVTNPMYGDLKRRILRSIKDREAEAKASNSPAVSKPGR